MFRDKHVYTCPDVIHIRNRQKKAVRSYMIGWVLVYGSLAVAAYVAGRRVDAELAAEAEKNPDN